MAKILVVDDSAFQRRLLRTLLEKEGHEVIEADNGNKGVIAAGKHRPDLILTDLLMPDADGFTLLEKLRNRGAKIPVLVVSSNIQSSAQERCSELGARGFVSKPVQPAALAEKLDEVLS